jgi:ribosomal protein L34
MAQEEWPRDWAADPFDIKNAPSVSRPSGIRDNRMHYPRKLSNLKRIRKQGFRARMKTSLGRRLLNRKRRHGFRKLSAS